MTAPVPIFQHEREFEQLLEVYRERAPRRVLEVGTFHGGTLYHWLQNAPDSAVVVSLDSHVMGVDNRRLYAGWCPAGVTVEAIAGDSHDPATIEQVAERAPFEWIWIDADHRYEAVRADWENFAPMCAPGGLVCFHDIIPTWDPTIEVDRLWAELRETEDTFEIVENPLHDWGGIGCVRR